ncbi:MAG TPA: TIGR03619 family F420-dependent LLM class oxidoreductase [Amycolatopsis sp.]|nr:TIGR03619 family F420-dependent LLM class oxidoreductase [Amycolatopsis sp.]
MKFGVNLTNFGRRMSPEIMLTWAKACEELGYHLLLVSDHVALTEDADSRSPAPFFEPFTTLSWLAGQTRKLRLGTGVVITPHRHPLLLARMTATLDQLSGGRFVLGVGVGWTRLAFEALDVPFQRRGALTDEYLAALLELWHNEIAGFTGPTVRFQGVHSGPQPVQRPHPPVWVGGNGVAALRRTARFGDAWHPLWPRREILPQALRALHALADSFDRPRPAFCPRIALEITETPLPEHLRSAGQGTVAQLRRDFDALAELGAEYVVVDTDTGDQRRRRPVEQELELLGTLADKVIDPAAETIR